MRDPLQSPEAQRLLTEYWRAADALHASIPPIRVTRQVGEPAAEFKLTPDQLKKISQLTEAFEEARKTLNEYCKRHGEPEWF